MRKTIIANSFSFNMINDKVGNIEYNRITKDEASKYIQEIGKYEDIIGCIGHADTANIVNKELGIDIAHERCSVVLDDETTCIIAQYTGPRLPEGTTELPAGATITYIMCRNKPEKN